MAGKMFQMIEYRPVVGSPVIKILLSIACFLSISTFNPGWCDFKDGATAMKSGDYELALQEWTSVALEGNKKAQYNLGVMHADGIGTMQNHVKAAKWYLLAAKQGYGSAQYNLAVLYQHGMGVPMSTSSALKWYHQAAENGIPEAFLPLGRAYTDGDGVPKNYSSAFIWLSLAVINGSPNASGYLQKVRQKMTRDQIALGNKGIQDWIKKH